MSPTLRGLLHRNKRATSAMGLLAALFDAQRTDRGRHVDISMADSMLAHAVVPMVLLAVRGQTRPAGTDRLSGGLPCYSVYATRDGRYLAVGALERRFWDRFCEVIGRIDLQPQHQPADDVASGAVRAELTEIIGSQTLAHWQQIFDGTGRCVTPVLRLEEALQDPHFRARGPVSDARVDGGAATVALLQQGVIG